MRRHTLAVHWPNQVMLSGYAHLAFLREHYIYLIDLHSRGRWRHSVDLSTLLSVGNGDYVLN